MTTAAHIRHAANTLELSTALARDEREPQAPGYWQGADDAIAWAIATLRARADEMASRATRLERLRTLAARASEGSWTTRHADDEITLLAGDDRRLGKTPCARTARYIVSAQPTAILSLLAALDDPSIEAPHLDELEDAARCAPRGPWAHTGIFLHADGEDLGWLHLTHDVDFIIAAHPALILDLIDALRAVRAA